MSKSALDNFTLVLNKAWQPIGTCTVRDAITLMSRNAAKGLDFRNFIMISWDKWISDKENSPPGNNFISSSNFKIPAPEVIILTKYDKKYFRKVRFTTKNLYRRDDHTCQYCLKKKSEDDLSVDHVVPRAKGGKTSWDNCVTACMNCNNKKADRTLAEAGLRLPRKPERPQWNPIIHVRPEFRPESWKPLVNSEWWETQ